MSTYASAFTGHAPGRFNLEHPDGFLDVAYDTLNPDDIRLTLKTITHTHWEDHEDTTEEHLTHTETRELALRLLIAIGTPHHLVKPLLDHHAQDPQAHRDEHL